MAEKLASAEARQAAERVESIRLRFERSTEGTWIWYNGNSWWRLGLAEDQMKDAAVMCPTNDRDGHPNLNISGEDMEFIAHAHQDIPFLLALADSYAAVVRERDEARNCTVCSYCGEIQRHIDSWEKKVDAILAHIETCPKSPLKQLLDAKQALEAAERLNRELVEAIKRHLLELKHSEADRTYHTVVMLEAAIKSATPLTPAPEAEKGNI